MTLGERERDRVRERGAGAGPGLVGTALFDSIAALRATLARPRALSLAIALALGWRRSRTAWIAPLILVSPLVARAQAPTPVTWAVRVPDVSTLKTGAEVTVLLTATIASGWHIYSLTQKPGGPIPMSIAVPAGEPFVLARAVKGPKPEIQSDATLGVPIELYSGTAEFPVPLKVTVTGAGAVLEGRITTRYQVCSDTTCLPPRNLTLPVRVESQNKDGAR